MKNFSLLIENISLEVREKWEDFKDLLFYYGKPQPKLPTNLPERLNFHLNYERDTNSYFMECIDLSNIYTAAHDLETLMKNFNDAVFHHLKVSRRQGKMLGLFYKLTADQVEEISRLGNKPITVEVKREQPAFT